MTPLIPAKPPFVLDEYVVRDADNDLVLTCNEGVPACALWKDRPSQEHASCPKCGRIQIRMEYATPEQCGMETKP